MILKKKRRRVKRGSSGSKLYFDENTQSSIIKFQNTNSAAERQTLYRKDIMPAFEKLAENLILIYRFASRGESIDSLKNDCVSFLYESIHKWNPDRGTKAFSYYNVVAKNWLIINSRQKKRERIRKVCIDDTTSMTKSEYMSFVDFDTALSPADIMINKENQENVRIILQEIKQKLTRDIDILCIDAVIKVFEMAENLDFLNKRAIFVYIRDISGLNSKQLSSAMSTVRKYYREIDKSLFL